MLTSSYAVLVNIWSTDRKCNWMVTEIISQRTSHLEPDHRRLCEEDFDPSELKHKLGGGVVPGAGRGIGPEPTPPIYNSV